MKTLINNLKTIFEAAITAGTITATTVFKGLQDIPDLAAISQYPYIMIDDGGERVEDTSSNMAQNRFYSVLIEFACYSAQNVSEAMDNILDLSTQIKTVLEKEANRQKDGHIWGIVISPFEWNEDMYFFRGRRVTVDFIELENRYFQY